MNAKASPLMARSGKADWLTQEMQGSVEHGAGGSPIALAAPVALAASTPGACLDRREGEERGDPDLH